MEKSIVVGVLGGKGQIGRQVIRLLAGQGLKIICGTRSVQKEDEAYVDINDKKSLTEFIKDCDVVVNCTGPSFITSKKIMPEVLTMGKHYVDAFGWSGKETKECEKSAAVLNAGSVPGLIGILIKALANESTREIQVYSGGYEKGSAAALGDIILSSINGYSKSSSYCEKGKYVRDIERKEVKVETPKGSLKAQEIATDEIRKVSEKLNVPVIRNYNIWSDDKLTGIIMKGSVKAMECRLEEEYMELFGSLSKEIAEDQNESHLNKSLEKNPKEKESKEKESLEKEPWYLIRVVNSDEMLSETIEISTNNSSTLTAAVAAKSALLLSKGKIKPGVYWPFEVIEPSEMLDYLEELSFEVNRYGEV